LTPYNVLVAAEYFRLRLLEYNDTDIARKSPPLVNAVDVVCPMVYPSGYTWGFPSTATRSRILMKLSISPSKGPGADRRLALRFRPWLQAFRDYAFGGGDFNEDRMKIQIKAPTILAPAAICSGIPGTSIHRRH